MVLACPVRAALKSRGGERLAAGAEASDLVPVDVVTVTTGGHGSDPLVVLREHGSTRALPIAVGSSEADAIWARLTEDEPARPQSHDLMKSLLEAGGLRLRRADITGVQDDVYVATLRLERNGRPVDLDARPSDAIALALRCRAPIAVARALMDSKDSIDLRTHRGPLQVAGLTLQDLTPALAGRLGLTGAAGVVVSDVREGRFAGSLHRRDVLVAIGGEPVDDTFDAALKLDRLNPDRPAAVTVLRGGRSLALSVAPEPPATDDQGDNSDDNEPDDSSGGQSDQ